MTPKLVRLSQLKHHWTIYFFIIPSLVLVSLFCLYPLVSGALHSTSRWNGSDINEYTGVQNYKNLISQKDFWASFRVALIIAVWNIVKMIPAIAVAACINRVISGRSQFWYRVSFVAPMVVPILVLVLIWRTFFFDPTFGYLNTALASGLQESLSWFFQFTGLTEIFGPGKHPAWLGDGRLILFSAIIWGFPWVASFAVLTHLAKLQGVPKELTEAADLDGATWWTKFTRLELPMIKGSINILIVLVIIDTFRDAGMIYGLAGLTGGPEGAVTVPPLFLMREAFLNQNMGAACAVGLVLTILIMVMKKLLDNTMDWENLKPWQKISMRLVGFALIFVFYYGLASPFLAIVMTLVVIPWTAIFRAVERAFTPAASLQAGDPWQSTPREIAAQQAHEARISSPNYHRRIALKNNWLRFCKHALIWFILILAYIPLILMLIVSFKSNQQYYTSPGAPTFPLHVGNWSHAWNVVTPSLANSIFITVASTAVTLLFSLCGAYFFARVKVPGSDFLWAIFLALMTSDTITNIAPLFDLLKRMDLLNTLTCLIAVGAAAGQMFAIYVLRNFIADLPQDLFEAAEIDGASHFRQLFTIVAPLCAPILGVIGLMHAIGRWNEFIFPLIVITDSDKLPLMVQLMRMNGEYIKEFGPMMAGYAMASIPIIFLFIACMRLFTRGLTEGAVKG